MTQRSKSGGALADRESAHFAAAEALVWLLPRPSNWIIAVGRGLRKVRLTREFAAYDLHHEHQIGRPASGDELLGLGMVLIIDSRGQIPPGGAVDMSAARFWELYGRVRELLAALSA